MQKREKEKNWPEPVTEGTGLKKEIEREEKGVKQEVPFILPMMRHQRLVRQRLVLIVKTEA
jgi:hypothetical protein